MIKILLDRFSAFISIPQDQLLAALSLILSFPFAFFFHYVITLKSERESESERDSTSTSTSTSTSLINFLAIGPTYFFLWLCFYNGSNLIYFLCDLLSIHIPIVTVYLSLRHFPAQPTLIFGLLLLQLSYHHLSHQLNFYNQYTVTVSGPLMVLIIKLSAFAYDVHDKKIDMKRVQFFRFLAWCLLFAGFFTGPVVMYKEFDRFCTDRKAFIKEIIGDEENKQSVLTGRKRRAFFLFISAVSLFIFSLFLQSHFPSETLLSISQSHDSIPLWFRLIFLHLTLLGWRIKYYVAWMLGEGALVIIGFGLIRKNGKIKWDRYENVNFFKIESSSDFKSLISEWNVTTNSWLNKYIYQRLGRTFSANLITYLVSAFWHGFYPGYYLTFISGALYTALSRNIYKSFTWPFEQKYRRICLYVPNYLLFDYFAAPFVLQTFSDSWKFCKAWHFYGHLTLIFLFLFVKLFTMFVKKHQKNHKD